MRGTCSAGFTLGPGGAEQVLPVPYQEIHSPIDDAESRI